MTRSSKAIRASLISSLTALAAVFTLLVKIPTGKGYLNLCDVVIFFAAFTFNPLIAASCAGLGTALADVIGGYPQWALISFAVHGLEGLLAGLLARFSKPLALAVGVAIVPLGYLALGGLLTGYAVALMEAPLNLLQSLVGAVLGVMVSRSVKASYPPVYDLLI